MSEPSSSPRIPTAELLAQAGWMRSLARALVLDPSRADDVVQEAWLAALARPPADRRNLRGWLARVLRNAALQIDRHEGRRRERERRVARRESSAVGSSVDERVELHRSLVDAVRSLGEPYRTTILLRYFEGLDAEEIAAREGIQGTLVRTRLARGLEKLRARLDGEHDGDRRAWCLALCPLGGALADGPTVAPGSLLGPATMAAGVAALLGGLIFTAFALRSGVSKDPDSASLTVTGEVEVIALSSERRTARNDDRPVRIPLDATAGGHGASSPLEERLREGKWTRLVGRVFDFESGSAIAGAELHVEPAYHEGAEPLARSDEEGRFELQSAGPSDVRLVVLAEGYAGLRRVLDLETARSAAIDLPLIRGASIEGRITDRGGRPVEGATVSIRSAPVPLDFTPPANRSGGPLADLPDSCWLFAGRDPDQKHVRTEPVGRSDAGGSFRIDGRVANGGAAFVRVHFEHPDYAVTSSEVLKLEMPSGVARTSIVMERGAALRGRVMQNGRPAVAVVRWSSEGDTSASVEVDAEGHYSFDNVPPGEVSLSARDPRFRRLREERTLKLDRGEERFEELDLSYQSHTISGRVTGAQDEPIEGASITVLGKGPGRWELVRGTSDEDGEYAIELPEVEGRLYDVELCWAPLRLLRRDLPAGAHADFSLPRMGRVELEVVDARSGEEVTDYETFWREAGSPSFLAHTGDRPRGALPLPLGRIDLRVCAHEQNYRATTVRDVVVSAEIEAGPCRVELERGTRLDLQWHGEGSPTPADHIFFLLTEEQWPLVEGIRNRYLGYDFDVRGADESVHHEIRSLAMGLSHWGNRLDEHGAVSLRGVTPGRYRLKSIPDDLILEPRELVVPDAEHSPVNIHWRQTNR